MALPYIRKRAPFTPTDITGCQLWLDGNDPLGTGTQPTSGSTVATWADKSGNARNAPANTTGATFSSNKLGFTSGQYYVTPNFVASSTNTPSVFVVVQQTANTGGMNSEIIMATAGTPSYATLDIFGYQATKNATLNIYNNTSVNGSISISNPTILGVIGTGSPNYTAGFWGNGTLNVTVTGSATNPMSASSGYTIGANSGFVGNIYEIIFYSVTVTTAQQQQIEGYLAQKWNLKANLPQNHPGLKGIITPSLPVNLFIRYEYPTNALGVSRVATLPARSIAIYATARPIVYIATNLLLNLDTTTYSSGSTWTATVGNNYTVTGTVTTTSTPGGSTALVFNGSSYAQDQTGITSTTMYSYTLDIWFYAAANVSGSIVGEQGAVGVPSGWTITLITVESNTINVGFWNGGIYKLSLGSYTANTWTHVSCTYNYSTNTLVGYVNGAYVATGTATKQWPTTMYISLAGNANPNPNFTGRIGPFKLYSTVLNATQVSQNYTGIRSRFI